HVNITTELTTRATREITIAPRAALILVEPSFKQMVHVAADTPESIAKRIADVGTFTSLTALGLTAPRYARSVQPSFLNFLPPSSRTRRAEAKEVVAEVGEDRMAVGCPYAPRGVVPTATSDDMKGVST